MRKKWDKYVKALRKLSLSVNVNYSFHPVDWHIWIMVSIFQSQPWAWFSTHASDPSLIRQCGGKLGQLKGRVPGWCQDPGRQKTLQDIVIWGQRKQGITYSGSQKRVKKYKVAIRGNTWQVKTPGQRDENKEQKFTKSQGTACQELGVQARSERPVGSAAQPRGTWSCSRQKHQHKTCKHRSAQKCSNGLCSQHVSQTTVCEPVSLPWPHCP